MDPFDWVRGVGLNIVFGSTQPMYVHFAIWEVYDFRAEIRTLSPNLGRDSRFPPLTMKHYLDNL
jgi:hypothetical protein